MFKSLYSGISGLSANLMALDVIGNNIANSNTIGFKSGRANFSEMLTQTIRSASRPVPGGLGGTNPQQIGLGTRVASIDTNLNQGNFQTTGKKTDLAIQGGGFFVLSDGTTNVFTRAGVFGLDAENNFVDPATGMKVQGVMADEDGVIGTGPLTDIFIDPGLVVPAEASTEVRLFGNLDADSDATGSIWEGASLLVAAEGADRLIDMSGQQDGTLGLYAGSVIRVNGNSGGAPLPVATYTVNGNSTYQDMVDWLNSAGLGLNFSILASGGLQVTNGTGALVEGLSLTSSGTTNFADNFQFEPSIAAGATSETSWDGVDGALRGYADAGDAIVDLFAYDGTPLALDLSTGSAILDLTGRVGDDAVAAQLTVTAGTTVADLLQEIQFMHGISSTPVEINGDGQIVVSGEVGASNALSDISISENGVENAGIDDVFSFHQTQQARDRRDFTVATTIYDSLGGEHIINFTFQKIAGENTWVWEAETDGLETITSGSTGQVTFSEDGVITSFTFDGGGSSMTIQPQPDGETRAEDITMTIDYGTIGELSGLTQFEGNTTVQSQADGFTAGNLVDYAIDQNGVITGQFSNDTLRDIARVALADFSNPGGLMREANNTYRTSGNSGDAMSFFAGEGNGVTLVPGALETSNVDLAMEFTKLVVAQRSFQANSRVITTGDQVMQELVNLIR